MQSSKSPILSLRVLALVLGFAAMSAPLFAASKENVLYSFCSLNYCVDGEQPDASLIFDPAGNLYGTAYAGGTWDDGVVFQLAPNHGGWTEKVLYIFNGNNGAGPSADLVLDAAGNLYGAASEGGSDENGGSVFELMPNHGKWTGKVLHLFHPKEEDGASPQAGLIWDASGNLYGTTQFGGAHSSGCTPTGYGCGTVFELILSHGKWTEKVLYSFNGVDGANPQAGLALDASGNLYGTTHEGGAFGYGTVFELQHKNGRWTEKVLHSFNLRDGAGPAASVIQDRSGNLYGTTWYGGASGSACFGNGCGTVFELTPNRGHWTHKVLHNFYPDTNGYSLPASLTFDKAGNLYSVTNYGGSDHLGCGGFGCGTVFELSPIHGKWTLKVVHSFSGADGGRPWGGLIFDKGGNLYGTTVLGGAIDAGTVFEITP